MRVGLQQAKKERALGPLREERRKRTKSEINLFGYL